MGSAAGIGTAPAAAASRSRPSTVASSSGERPLPLPTSSVAVSASTCGVTLRPAAAAGPVAPVHRGDAGGADGDGGCTCGCPGVSVGPGGGILVRARAGPGGDTLRSPLSSCPVPSRPVLAVTVTVTCGLPVRVTCSVTSLRSSLVLMFHGGVTPAAFRVGKHL